MEYYNFVQAQAYEIADCQRQEEVEDNNILDGQSDSELLVPASTVFDGIEGIEPGPSIELG